MIFRENIRRASIYRGRRRKGGKGATGADHNAKRSEKWFSGFWEFTEGYMDRPTQVRSITTASNHRMFASHFDLVVCFLASDEAKAPKVHGLVRSADFAHQCSSYGGTIHRSSSSVSAATPLAISNCSSV